MKYTLSLLLFCCANCCLGQFSCDNIDLLGIYRNNFDIYQLSLLLTNKSSTNDGNHHVYTLIALLNQEGDTLLYSDPVYTLPGSKSDTFVYNIPLHSPFSSISDLPAYRCGTLITAFPNCQISYCLDSIPAISLPPTQNLDCNDFKIAGLYETAIGGTRNYSFLLTNLNQDSLRNWLTGYTAFQFFDTNDQAISAISSPSYFLPKQHRYTIIVHMNLDRQLVPGEQVTVKMFNPECEVLYEMDLISSQHEPLFPSSIRVYPNPTQHVLFIESEQAIESVEILTLEGKLVQKGNRRHIVIHDLTPGIYMVIVYSKLGRYVKRFEKV